ncbi:hypothetical protein [Paenibacillus sp. JCM 10914]|uniref:hypothetical protein n=1 Tax=Paenibacillus sp. JCM 10914 TaxID=1236974 RepID=UPI0011DE0A03|nr:hypothetical protein [Paenibacillus sp. JCM 10914]
MLESFVVEPVAKNLAFSLPYDKSKKVLVVLSMALCMVTGMVFCMSWYGLLFTYLSNGLNGMSLLESYFAVFIKNYVLALPFQLILGVQKREGIS